MLSVTSLVPYPSLNRIDTLYHGEPGRNYRDAVSPPIFFPQHSSPDWWLGLFVVEEMERGNQSNQPARTHPRAKREISDSTLLYALAIPLGTEVRSREGRNTRDVGDSGKDSQPGYASFNMPSETLTLTSDCSQDQRDLKADGNRKQVEQPAVG